MADTVPRAFYRDQNLKIKFIREIKKEAEDSRSSDNVIHPRRGRGAGRVT